MSMWKTLVLVVVVFVVAAKFSSLRYSVGLSEDSWYAFACAGAVALTLGNLMVHPRSKICVRR